MCRFPPSPPPLSRAPYDPSPPAASQVSRPAHSCPQRWQSAGESLAKWNFNEFKTCWAGQEKELGLGYATRKKKKKQKLAPCRGDLHKPIASDKQVLGELRLVETKNTQNPSWLLKAPPTPSCSPVPGIQGAPQSYRLRECWEAIEAPGKLLGPQGATGSLRGPSVVLGSLKRATGSLWEWESCWSSGEPLRV